MSLAEVPMGRVAHGFVRSKNRLGTPAMNASETSRFCYVYILQSLKDPAGFYTGFTENIRDRLDHHNRGQSVHTASLRPWKIKTCIAFTDREQALEFERYLKTASGRAFAKKRL